MKACEGSKVIAVLILNFDTRLGSGQFCSLATLTLENESPVHTTRQVSSHSRSNAMELREFFAYDRNRTAISRDVHPAA